MAFEEKNCFFPFSETITLPNFIGLYDGRKEDNYTPQKKNATLFGMVLHGAFEFQNRLMENRDAIVLWDTDELEFEALSEEALLLFIEV